MAYVNGEYVHIAQCKPHKGKVVFDEDLYQAAYGYGKRPSRWRNMWRRDFLYRLHEQNLSLFAESMIYDAGCYPKAVIVVGDRRFVRDVTKIDKRAQKGRVSIFGLNYTVDFSPSAKKKENCIYAKPSDFWLWTKQKRQEGVQKLNLFRVYKERETDLDRAIFGW